jgi:hypothetical protein
MELAWGFRRKRSDQPVDLIDAHSGLAGLFVGDGVIDEDLMTALLERSWVTDETLLSIASGRREEAHRLFDEAIEEFEVAIASAHATGAVELAAHARFDQARVLLKRAFAGDAERAKSLLAQAESGARERRMGRLLSRIEELAPGGERSAHHTPGTSRLVRPM